MVPYATVTMGPAHAYSTCLGKFDDGSDYYTLPMLHVPSTNTTLGDSFDIATFLDENFPTHGAGRLFPPRSRGKWQGYESPAPDVAFAPITTNAGAATEYAAYAKFNLHVDATFSTAMVGYGQYLPFNPKTADAAKAQMCKRAHLNSWDDLVIVGEARKALKEPFRQSLRGLAECFEGGGVFLEGATACYADLIVGGWLNMMSVLMPQDEWEDFRTWHDGVFAKLHDELQAKYFVCN